MNTRTAAPVLITMSLVVLMSGCAGAAAQGGQVHDYLSPVGNAAAVGLARGHVVAEHDLANRVEAQIEQARQADAARAWSADARREFHAAAPEQALSATTWSADARREFHAQQPGTVTSRTLSPEAIRELKAGAPVGVTAADMQGERLSAYAEARDAAIRELKAGAPTDVVDTLSPIRGWTPPSEPPDEPVDDYLSPLGGSR